MGYKRVQELRGEKRKTGSTTDVPPTKNGSIDPRKKANTTKGNSYATYKQKAGPPGTYTTITRPSKTINSTTTSRTRPDKP